MAKDWVCRESEKTIFSVDKVYENVKVDVYSSWCEERKKKSKGTMQNTHVSTDSVSLNIQKKWMCLGTTLLDEILYVLKGNAE